MPNVLEVQRFIGLCRSYGQKTSIAPTKNGIFDQVRYVRPEKEIRVREIAGFARVEKYEYEMRLSLGPDKPAHDFALKASLKRQTLDQQGEIIEGTSKTLHEFYAFGFTATPRENPREYFGERSIERLFSLIATKRQGFLSLIEQFNSFVSSQEKKALRGGNGG